MEDVPLEDAQDDDAKDDNAKDDDAQDAGETTPGSDQEAASATEAPAEKANPEKTVPEKAAVDAVPTLRPAPVRHSGDKVADRYRLEECISQAGVFTSWRAVDETLRRAVGIHLLASGHERSRAVLAAARSAALLGDPRFVQVLDAVTDGDLVYIVREWLPDATDLASLLAAGPMEPYDAYQMVRQVTDAIVLAHRRGQSHLRLTPKSVLRTDGGQYRINGIAVDAALHGLSDDEAERDDTRAIAALLYAALAHRWPYPEDKYDLQGMPRQLGCVPPDQVRAGVHRGLSEIAVRALCDEPPRHLEAITTPEELAKAIALLPKVRQPEPEPVAAVYPPAYPKATGPARSPFPPPAAVPPHAPAPAPAVSRPQARPGRGARAAKWGASVVLLAALGVGSWVLASNLRSQGDNGSTTQGQSAGVDDDKPTPSKAPAKPLTIVGAAEFSPHADPMSGDKVQYSYDGDPNTAWITKQFHGFPNFGNLDYRADGAGIVVDLGSVKSVSAVKTTLYVAGQQVDVRAAAENAASPRTLADFPRTLQGGTNAGKQLDVDLSAPVRTRYVLIHITSLPPESPGLYRGGISEIQVLG
ncbi:serine/threonine protein kinase [Peterkaempfera bronchialis]|uniref:Serine/threonine protein kinase n=1 Tax=Peterkaempfera bronchialis TaxID=2126346 RepID=A0A345T628_9ACTN|nr:serine/threonine protein kinase [Peterkaempfera bronchialis]